MVIYDSKADACAIYEIKHSTQIVSEQYRHLCDEEKCEKTEHRFGEIMKKTVLYRGESSCEEIEGGEIIYENAAEFLKELPDSMDINEGQGFSFNL